MFKVIVAQSDDPDSADAIAEVLASCKAQLGTQKPKAALFYGAVEYDYQLQLDAINKEFPGIELIGGSTVAEMTSAKGYGEGTIVLVLFVSDKIAIKATVIRNLSTEKTKGVKAALDEVRSKLNGEPTLAIMMAEFFGSSTDLVRKFGLTELIESLKMELGDTFPIIGGGISSDVAELDRVREFYKTEVLRDSAILLFFSGPIEFSVGVSSGWMPFTSAHDLNESKVNVLYKIAEKKALDFYFDYIGGVPTLVHPLAVYEKDDENFYLRGPIWALEDERSLIFNADFPKKGKARIAKSDPEKIIHASGEAAKKANETFPNKGYVFGFLLSCFCRRQILGTRTNEEFETIKKELKEIPLFGFYGFGQFGPYQNDKEIVHHIETCVILLFKEKDGN